MKNKLNLKENKKLIVEIISVVALLCIITGISVASGYWSYISSKDNTLEAGDISLTYLESNNSINLTNALPMSDNDGKLLSTSKFEFAVTTNSGYIQTISYDLNIESLIVDTGYVGLDPDSIKVYLTDKSGNVLVSPTKISDLEDFTLYTNKHNHTEAGTKITTKYVLRAWIDKDVEASDWYTEYVDENKQYQYKFRVNVNAEATELEQTGAEMLIAKTGTSGLEVVTHEADSTLQIGATQDITEYRYRGGDDVVTNNYIYFNCSDINNQTADTCELYRIIGVFPTDDGNGNIENRIKIIKAENYGDNYWNTDDTNNWAEASLNTIFNKTYYNSINEAYQNLIGDTKYYLGGYSDSDIYTNVMYQYERKISGSDYYYGSNPNSWTGKIGLMYVSDYGYAANSDCSTSTALYNYATNSCLDNNWLYLGSAEWLLTQTSSYSNLASLVTSSGFIGNASYVSRGSYAVRPALYLASNAEISDVGDGSSTNPYQLSSN